MNKSPWQIEEENAAEEDISVEPYTLPEPEPEAALAINAALASILQKGGAL
jgi:hypothetical protein